MTSEESPFSLQRSAALRPTCSSVGTLRKTYAYPFSVSSGLVEAGENMMRSLIS